MILCWRTSRRCTSPCLTTLLAYAGWAMWTKSHHMWAQMLFLAQIIRSAFICVEGLTSKVQE